MRWIGKSAMPFDDFQKAITNVLCANRNRESPFAGGSVIQRLCVDQDTFKGWDVEDIASRDIALLREAGYTVSRGTSYDGFLECIVASPPVGRTILQWTHGLSREFYQPVPDELFGFRLPFADLAVNKALAAGSRMQMRDVADLWMLDRHVIPLWRIVCAAPGKDPEFSPLSLVEAIARNWHFARTRTAHPYEATFNISDDDMAVSLRDSLNEARMILEELPAGHQGFLQVAANAQPVLSRDTERSGDWIAPSPGGCMPSFKGDDSEMIAGLIAEFGPDGSRHARTTMASYRTVD